MDGVERTSAYHIIKFNHIFTPFYVDVYFPLEKRNLNGLISLYCNLLKVDFDIRTCKMLISKFNGVIAYIYQLHIYTFRVAYYEQILWVPI